MAKLIDMATRRVAVASPALTPLAADALGNAIIRLGEGNVDVIMDCNEEVFRLGYGDVEALKKLRALGCVVRQSSGLRVGVLVCDDQAWVFAPTALYVQAETQSDETPNAVSLRASDVGRIFSGMAASEGGAGERFSDESGFENFQAEVEIGHEEISDQVLCETQKALEQAPPVAFDVARQVRVFSPYIQYVEISLHGCAIQRRRIEVPKSFQALTSNAEITARLRTTFELIGTTGDLSLKELEDEVYAIRDALTKVLGKPWGRVLLRAKRPLFDQRIDKFRTKLEEHKKSVKERLAKYLAQSREQLIEYFLPFVEQSVPEELLGQITTANPSKDQISAWLDDELNHVFPTPSDLIAEMTLDVQFRDVTYETLKEHGFAEKLREVYPQVEWNKPFTEFDAASARDSA